MKAFKVYYIRPSGYKWWYHGSVDTLDAAKKAAASILAAGPGKVMVYDSHTGERVYEANKA